jgi:membrane-associated phospholipid phosphatase
VLAVHWLSDVVAGWALGTAIAITLVVALWFSQTRHPGPNQRPPASRSIDR